LLSSFFQLARETVNPLLMCAQPAKQNLRAVRNHIISFKRESEQAHLTNKRLKNGFLIG
jgi:hypothetical protein